jgi:hypothetical protein
MVSESTSVIIIGNSRSVLDHEYGKVINDFDIVIRIGFFLVEGFEKYVGAKTDIVTYKVGMDISQFREVWSRRTKKGKELRHIDNDNFHIILKQLSKRQSRNMRSLAKHKKHLLNIKSKVESLNKVKNKISIIKKKSRRKRQRGSSLSKRYRIILRRLSLNKESLIKSMDGISEERLVNQIAKLTRIQKKIIPNHYPLDFNLSIPWSSGFSVIMYALTRWEKVTIHGFTFDLRWYYLSEEEEDALKRRFNEAGGCGHDFNKEKEHTHRLIEKCRIKQLNG